MKGLTVKENKTNPYTVLSIHYSSDPFKDKKWKEQEQKSFPNPNEWKRLYEIDFAGLEGTPVHPTFREDKHVLAVGYNPLKPLLRGWEFGVEVSVCKVYQIDKYGRFITLAEYVKRRVTNFRFFAAAAMQFCEKHFDKGVDRDGRVHPLIWEDYADHAGNWQGDGTGQFYCEILADFGLSVRTAPFSKTLKMRSIELVSRLLNETVKIKVSDTEEIETPKFVLEVSNPVSIEAYNGGYVYGKETASGLRPLDPNHPYEDVCDTDHYVMVHKFNLVEQPKRTKEQDTYPKLDPMTGYFVEGVEYDV